MKQRLAYAFLTVTIAACGGEDAVDIGGGGSNVTCPEHPNIAAMGTACAIRGSQNDPVTTDLRLTADNVWLLDGPVFIGDDENETVLTIDPGTTVFGGNGSFLLIQRASKLMAEGTAAAPIVLTSAKEVGTRGASDWGGLVINGRAPINNGDAADGSAPGEVDTGRYGGNLPTDSSGVIRYLRVEFAGNKVDAENELNGIAFQGVGSGTTVEFIQAHMSSDDGFEFFGGTVQAKYIVVTGADDDSIDWTGGWTGGLQFVAVQQLAASGLEAERGIEGDNLEGNNSATPFSNPTLSNLTLIARPDNPSDGIVFRRGTQGALHNSVITGFGGACISVASSQTEDNVADNSLIVDNLVHDCGSAIEAGASTILLGRTEANVVALDPMLDGWIPSGTSPALDIGPGPTGEFFETVTYAGAFDGVVDWTTGWIEIATE